MQHLVDRACKRLRHGQAPIVIGPWLSEVGYELLYWIPFVAWVQNRYRLDPARLVVVSRGGCQSWYAHVAARYMDVFTWFTLEEFLAENAARIRKHPKQNQKHYAIGGFDKAILAKVREVLDEEPAGVLHPSLMYQMFRTTRPWHPGWQAYARHQPFQTVRPFDGLPANYVAVRCYSSKICPVSPESQAVMTDLVQDILRTQPVVLLNPGRRFDDHDDYTFPAMAGVHTVDQYMTPATNFDVQTRVIAGASRVVGTYGGYAYLPPMLGVDTDTVVIDQAAFKKMRHHLTVAEAVFAHRNYGRLTVIPPLREERACA